MTSPAPILTFPRALQASVLVEWQLWNDIYRIRKTSLIHRTRIDDPMITNCGLYLPATATFIGDYAGPMLCKRCNARFLRE